MFEASISPVLSKDWWWVWTPPLFPPPCAGRLVHHDVPLGFATVHFMPWRILVVIRSGEKTSCLYGACPSYWSHILKGAVGRKGRSVERDWCGELPFTLQSHPSCLLTPWHMKEPPCNQSHWALAGLGEGQPDSSVFLIRAATLVLFQSYVLINLDTSLSFPKACWTSGNLNFSSDEVHSDEFQLIWAKKQSQSLNCSGGCLTRLVLFIIGKTCYMLKNLIYWSS